MNGDKNYLGRLLALALILGTAYGVQAIARGRYECGLAGHCVLGLPPLSGVPPAPDKAAPVEKTPAAKPFPAKASSEVDSGEGEEAALEKKAPLAPPSPSRPAK